MGYGLIDLDNEIWNWLRVLAALEGKYVDDWITEILEKRVEEARQQYPGGLESINVDMSFLELDLKALEDLARIIKTHSEANNTSS